jgi:two-component system sensor histidine kinase/response regulator
MSGFANEARAALAAGEPERAARRAHDLKGLAGTIGAHRLRALANTLHHTLRVGEPASGPLDELIEELDKVVQEIDAVSPTA